MKRLLTCVAIVLFSVLGLSAQQDGFYVELSNDTILAGNVLEVSFRADNIAGQFEAPEMKDLNIVSGPNTSSSMSMVNGTITQQASYSFGIYVEDIGEVIIPPAYFVTKEGTLETEPQSILVLPNPEGIIEEPPAQSGFYQFSFPQNSETLKKNKKAKKDQKKKRKLKKI